MIARGWIKGKSLRGHSYAYWGPPMPIIPEYFLDSAIYLYATVADAEAGARSGGSGCFVGIPFASENFNTAQSARFAYGHLYAVTNSHVVDPLRGNSPVIRMNTKDGHFEAVEAPSDAWIHHPDGDDLAVLPLGLDSNFRVAAFSPSSFVQVDEPGWYLPGTETFTVGRFVTHEGRQRNLPTVRFGNISMLPWEPIQTEPGGRYQDSFLVEEHSLSGASGSPVFVYSTMPEAVGLRPTEMGEDPPHLQTIFTKFLGINWGHLKDWEPITERDSRPKVDQPLGVYRNTGMAVVVPAWKLDDLLNTKELVEMREEEEQEWAEKHKHDDVAAMDTLTPEPETEYSRFEDLTRRLVNTPKPEREGES